MAVLGDQLFRCLDRRTLDQELLLRGSQGVVEDSVAGLPDAAFANQTVDSLTQTVIDKLRIVPLSRCLDSAIADVIEIPLDAQGPFGNVRVRAVRTTKTIPFTGDAMLWHLQQSPYDENQPYGEIADQTLVLRMSDMPEQEADQAMERAIQQIAQYLKWQEDEIVSLNRDLRSSVLRQVRKRRLELNKRPPPNR